MVLSPDIKDLEKDKFLADISGNTAIRVIIVTDTAAAWLRSLTGYVYLNTITDSVNIGGAGVPAEKLDVTGNILASGSVYVPYISSRGATPLRLQTNNITRMYIDNTNGWVGIGTITPAAGLQVTPADGSIRGGDNTYYVQMDVGDNWAKIFGQGQFGSWFIGQLDDFDTGALLIKTQTADAIILATSGANERMRITPAGLIGIGNNTPTQKVDVVGQVKIANGANAPLNVPVLAANPAAPANGDVWIYKNGATQALRFRAAGITYSCTGV